MGRSVISVHESPLGRWTRTLYFPDAPLASYVGMCWHVEGRASYARDRRLPVGRAHLLFNLGTPPLLFGRDAVTEPRSFPTCWIAGQHESYLETGSHGETVLLGVQFTACGAYRLLGAAQHELSGEVIELEALLGDRVLQLRERLLQARTPEARFAVLQLWMLALLEHGRPVHPGVLATERAIAAAPGEFDLASLSRDLGYSREHLIRVFREQVGLTPKAYANILRFGRALQSARSARASWAGVAAECGYCDQAHLVHDFQRYAGRAPTSLLRDGRPDPDSIVVG
jgi:AraC-like DNA-binding protein